MPSAEFVVHDASITPLPGSPADVVYARLLLAHLPDPAGTADRWRGELRPDGVLLVEDLEDIDAPPGPLRDYDELAAAIVRSGGGPMYAGRALAGLGGACVEVRVPAPVAAAIYLFNVVRWLSEPPAAVDADRLAVLPGLHHDLESLAAGDDPATVRWIVRQLALRGE